MVDTTWTTRIPGRCVCTRHSSSINHTRRILYISPFGLIDRRVKAECLIERSTHAVSLLSPVYAVTPAVMQIQRAATAFPVSRAPAVAVKPRAACSRASTKTATLNAADLVANPAREAQPAAASGRSTGKAMIATTPAKPLVSSVSDSRRA